MLKAYEFAPKIKRITSTDFSRRNPQLVRPVSLCYVPLTIMSYTFPNPRCPSLHASSPVPKQDKSRKHKGEEGNATTTKVLILVISYPLLGGMVLHFPPPATAATFGFACQQPAKHEKDILRSVTCLIRISLSY